MPFIQGKLRHTDGHATHFHLRVRGGQEHKKWSEVTHDLDHKVLAKLKRNALKPSDRPSVSVKSAAMVSRTATVNRTSRGRLTRKRPRSLAAVRARASAQRARLRAKLRAAQARARRRLNRENTSTRSRKQPPPIEKLTQHRQAKRHLLTTDSLRTKPKSVMKTASPILR